MNILMVEDNVQDADLLAATLRRVDSDTRIDCAQTLSQACRQVREVECELCPRNCVIPEGAAGDCRIRVNLDGRKGKLEIDRGVLGGARIRFTIPLDQTEQERQ